MLRVYIAGPYSAPDVIDVLGNMRRGICIAYQVLQSGFAPFVPWFDFMFSLMGPVSREEYQAYSMAWLRAADAVLLVNGWKDSSGTLAEIEVANRLEIPVFEDLISLKAWAHERATGQPHGPIKADDLDQETWRYITVTTIRRHS